MELPLDRSPEVAAALAEGRPVVALESTLIAHGMPWPRNLETAFALEAAVREAGAVPATVAILDGRLRAGLDAAQVERIARAGRTMAKASRRDVAWALVAGASAATTVAATMIVAARAGIAVFATGGIGGVHRGAATSFDISADLLELARTPVAVVCAGPKAILDIGLTLQVLETHGVPVIGWRCDRLPAFWCVDSPWAVDHRADDADTVAALVRSHWALGGGGVLLANPIPPEQALPFDVVESAVGEALRDAAASGIAGAALTPFLLERVATLTSGDSLAANVALVLHNARVAAQVAAAYAHAGRQEPTGRRRS